LLRTSLFLGVIAILSLSCNPARRLTGPANGNPPIKSSGTDKQAGTSKRVYKGVHPPLPGINDRALPNLGSIESSSWLQFKYAVLTDAPVEAFANTSLLNYIEDWYGVPYRYGGSSKTGVDCSAFSMGLMASAFGVSIPRTVKEQYASTQRIEKSELQQGDLLFFDTKGALSHVGIYLVNNKFVHASTSNGVMISDLGEEYFAKKFVGAGRVK
jgi:cell wall-associated NlpC family hydrolase